MTRRPVLGWVLTVLALVLILEARARAQCCVCTCLDKGDVGACAPVWMQITPAQCFNACGGGSVSIRCSLTEHCAQAPCPTSEAGRCTDGVNNDAFRNDEMDCADAACKSDPACRGKAQDAAGRSKRERPR